MYRGEQRGGGGGGKKWPFLSRSWLEVSDRQSALTWPRFKPPLAQTRLSEGTALTFPEEMNDASRSVSWRSRPRLEEGNGKMDEGVSLRPRWRLWSCLSASGWWWMAKMYTYCQLLLASYKLAVCVFLLVWLSDTAVFIHFQMIYSLIMNSETPKQF